MTTRAPQGKHLQRCSASSRRQSPRWRRCTEAIHQPELGQGGCLSCAVCVWCCRELAMGEDPWLVRVCLHRQCKGSRTETTTHLRCPSCLAKATWGFLSEWCGSAPAAAPPRDGRRQSPECVALFCSCSQRWIAYFSKRKIILLLGWFHGKQTLIIQNIFLRFSKSF